MLSFDLSFGTIPRFLVVYLVFKIANFKVFKKYIYFSKVTSNIHLFIGNYKNSFHKQRGGPRGIVNGLQPTSFNLLPDFREFTTRLY